MDAAAISSCIRRLRPMFSGRRSDFYAWMVVVTLIPPAIAALVGEYAGYDLRRAEVRTDISALYHVALVLAARGRQRERQLRTRGGLLNCWPLLPRHRLR